MANAGLSDFVTYRNFATGFLPSPLLCLGNETCSAAAEAEVAVLLAAGLRLIEIARSRGVSLETVRAQPKSVLQKTGRSSQGQLISRLARGLAGGLGRG